MFTDLCLNKIKFEIEENKLKKNITKMVSF